MALAVVALAVALSVGCGSGSPAADDRRRRDERGGASSSGVLRIGTANYIDSLNPFNYIESQAYNAMIMIYPQLVQYGPGMKFEGDWAELVGRRPPTARTGRSSCGRTRSGRTASR